MLLIHSMVQGTLSLTGVEFSMLVISFIGCVFALFSLPPKFKM